MNSDGELASAASAASTGVSSATSRRSVVTPRIVPVPRTVIPSAPAAQSAPIAVSTSWICPAACMLCAGQSATVTLPPATRAAARNGAALDISGSMSIARGTSVPG